MKDPKTKTIRYENLHRGLSGIGLACFIITVIASGIAGASVGTIVYRSLVVIIVLALIGRILIRSWASWEEMRHGTPKKAKLSKK